MYIHRFLAEGRRLPTFFVISAAALMFWAGYDSTGALPVIQAATLLVVIWYAWQTHELTNEMRNQTEEMKRGLKIEQHKARISFANEVERFDPRLEFVDAAYEKEGSRMELLNVSDNTITDVLVRPWKDDAQWRLETVPNKLRNWEKGAKHGFRVIRKDPEARRIDIDLELEFDNVRSQRRRVRYHIVMEQVRIVESFTNNDRDTRGTDEPPEFT